MLVCIPEATRRQNHLSEVDQDHSLRPVILHCLKDKDNECPSAHQLCERLEDLKRMPRFIESSRIIQDKGEVVRSKEWEIQQLRELLQEENSRAEEKERQLNQEMIRMMQEENDRESSNKRRQLEKRERQLGRVNQQVYRSS